MEWAFALKAEDQSAGFRHFCRIIFDGLTALKRPRDFPRGNTPVEHPLKGVDAEGYLGIVHWRIILLHHMRLTANRLQMSLEDGQSTGGIVSMDEKLRK